MSPTPTAADTFTTAAAPVAEPTTAPAGPGATSFELGLVMAGAISAGAYTAGVIDFLLEALRNWHDPQARRAAGFAGEAPPHGITLKTMAGASAGGMCAALTATSLLAGNTTRLHDAWVNRIDIRSLLDTTDLNQATSLGKLHNLLNCEELTTIAQEALTLPTDRLHWPPWLDAKELNFFLTLTNLNGLVYNVSQEGGAPQRFTDHADRIQFRLLAPGEPTPTPPNPALRVLRAALPADLSLAEKANWAELTTAALATGAFPIALQNRQLFFDNDYYNRRAWWYGGAQWPQHVAAAGQPGQDSKPYPAPYLFVDGGLTNNEPFELVRRTLTGDATGRTPSNDDGQTSRQAALMIDPFPTADDPKFEVLAQELRAVILALYTTLRNQARYRSEDLLGALDLNAHSRFLIAPVRAHAPAATATHPAGPSLACGTLGAFGGFLHQPFREHDFQLGRRNCQRFLQIWLTLPATNGLFAKWLPAMQTKYQLVRPSDPAQVVRLPILPLLGTAATPVAEPSWAAAALPLSKLENELTPLLQKRLNRFTQLLQQEIPARWWWVRVGYSLFIRAKLRDDAQRQILAYVKQNLTAAGLLNRAA